GIPVHGVCSLDVIAAHVPRGREFLVATDARRKEVYWARYDAAGMRLEGPAVGSAASIPGAAGLAVAGSGGQLYPEAFGAVTGPAYPDARTLLARARRTRAPPIATPGRCARSRSARAKGRPTCPCWSRSRSTCGVLTPGSP